MAVKYVFVTGGEESRPWKGNHGGVPWTAFKSPRIQSDDAEI